MSFDFERGTEFLGLFQNGDAVSVPLVYCGDCLLRIIVIVIFAIRLGTDCLMNYSDYANKKLRN